MHQANANVDAQIGWGAAGSDPRSTTWTWTAASYNMQFGNDDEYQGSFVAPATAGSYSFAFRFSIDSGTSWTLADNNGAGSNAGLAFSVTDLGTLTVQASAIPEPATYAVLGGLAALGFAADRRRRKRLA